jgi:hypothetical protein
MISGKRKGYTDFATARMLQGVHDQFTGTLEEQPPQCIIHSGEWHLDKPI